MTSLGSGASASEAPAIAVAIRHRFSAGFSLDATFQSSAGVTALFGRSGSGKTSIANAIAGLLRPDWGRITVSGTALLDSDKRQSLPPHRRAIGYVFQEGRLLPHLSVRQNLLYGRWFAGGRQGMARFDDVVDLLGIGPLLARSPGALSGGEKQRVAVGRALLSAPRLLIMDEPLAALDAARKAEILPYLERLRDEAKLPIVYVSHAIGEVIRLADHMVLLSAGRVDAAGSVTEVMGRLDLYPITGRFEAGAVLEARVIGDEEPGLTRMRAKGGDLLVPRVEAPPGTVLRARIRARDVLLATELPRGLSALNLLPAEVAEIKTGETAGIAEVRVVCGGDPLLARLTQRSVATLGLVPGARVYAVIKGVAFDGRSLGLTRGRQADIPSSLISGIEEGGGE